jgi:hypothetical protein
MKPLAPLLLTRKYRDDLGDDEVKKRLTDEVAQVREGT